MEKPTVFVPAKEPFKSVTEDLAYFIHRVARSERASSAEIAALPEVAKVLFEHGDYGSYGSC